MSSRILEETALLEVMDLGTAGSLRVFGLRRPAAPTVSYVTLDEAMQANALVVTEVSEHGEVPTLVATTSSDVMVFLLAGEELIGAKQNRVINKSLMLPTRDRVRIPVSCVEQGRWHRHSRALRSGGSLSHGRLREMMHKDVRESYRRSEGPTPSQYKVWDEVHRKMEALGSASPSAALHRVYEDYGARLEEMLKAVRVPEDCCGAAFVIADRLAGIDVFDRPETLTKLWPKLLGAYALDALESPPTAKTTVAKAQVEEWLKSLGAAEVEQYDSPGVGQDLRFGTPGLVGAALIVEDRLVHAEVFEKDARA